MEPSDAARILLRRRRMRSSLVGFAQSIQIPGAPVGGDDSELFAPVGQTMARHHVLLCEALQTCIETDYGRTMVFMPPGAAKALALGTPIPTPGGWTTMGELRVGDQVFGDDGAPCNVTWVSPVWRDRPVYAVRTDCGDEIVADDDHEWRVAVDRKPRRPLKANGRGAPARSDRDDPASRFTIKETRDLARRRAKRPMIERARALVLPDADLAIDPYLLGVWLGDGSSEGGRLTASEADMPWLRAELSRLGYETRTQSVPTSVGVPGIRGGLVSLGVLKNKHIPAAYLRASEPQRLALLQGLIDTDGTVCKKRGCATFCNTNLALAEGVRELVRSLGRKAGWSEGRATLYGRDCGAVYHVSFYHSQAARMPRKQVLCRDQARTPNTYIDLVRAENCDTVCIEVDSPSHMFLAGRSMTPTHNSTYASAVAPAWAMGRTPGFQVILGSYGTDLAKKHGRKARAICKQGLYLDAFSSTVRKDTSAAEMWACSNGSEYMAGGLLSGLTGNRADLLIIDDPIKGAQEADSPATRASVMEAIEQDAMTRLKPRASVFLIQTRWHPLDPAGQLLPEDYDGRSGPVVCSDGMTWNVLNIPAEAEREDDPLGRAPGEMLWPEWFDAAHWNQYRAKPRLWASLYQQRPVIAGGGRFKPEWVEWYEPGEAPAALNYYGADDYAVTEADGANDPDFTEMGVVGLDEKGDFWFVDWFFGQVSTDKGIREFIKLASKYRIRRWFGEKGVIHNSLSPAINRAKREARCRTQIELIYTPGNKMAKAEGFFSLAEQGKVHFPNLPWAHRLVAQLAAFPVVAHDDGVDVCALFGRALDGMAWAHVPPVVEHHDLKPFSVAWLEYRETQAAAGPRTR